MFFGQQAATRRRQCPVVGLVADAIVASPKSVTPAREGVVLDGLDSREGSDVQRASTRLAMTDLVDGALVGVPTPMLHNAFFAGSLSTPLPHACPWNKDVRALRDLLPSRSPEHLVGSEKLLE